MIEIGIANFFVILVGLFWVGNQADQRIHDILLPNEYVPNDLK
jgi:hypothetical protein